MAKYNYNLKTVSIFESYSEYRCALFYYSASYISINSKVKSWMVNSKIYSNFQTLSHFNASPIKNVNELMNQQS